jgi:hypothetical protein
MSEWQAIETAPKDGTRILLFIPGVGVEIGYWLDTETVRYGKVEYSTKKWTWNADLFGFKTAQPAHWMPLPKPPAEVPRGIEEGTNA